MNLKSAKALKSALKNIAHTDVMELRGEAPEMVGELESVKTFDLKAIHKIRRLMNALDCQVAFAELDSSHPLPAEWEAYFDKINGLVNELEEDLIVQYV